LCFAAKKSERGKDLCCKRLLGCHIIVFVIMGIMSARTIRFSYIVTLTSCLLLWQVCTVLSADLSHNVARLKLGAHLDDKIAEAALLLEPPTIGYPLSEGQTDLVLSLAKIENLDHISFQNNGAVGIVTIFASNSRLAVASSQWHQIAKQALSGNITKIKFGPTEAKYVKLSFSITGNGRIAALGAYSTTNLTMASANLTVGAETATDGKDAKDFGGKEAKEVAEAPAEGPPPNLPDPPPFVFTPQVVPLSE
jgi:hypothetical protein